MAKPILLFNVIHSETARDFTEKVLSVPEKEAIDILINSPGGSLSAGWSMLAVLQDRKAVNMKVVGDASSMAFFFLLFATKTTAFDTSTFLIHRAAGHDESELDKGDLKDIESRNKIIREKLEARIDEDKFIKVTGKTFDDIFSMKGQLDVNLTANEAFEIGLIDEVIKLDVKKREQIEAEYFDKIAALAEPINSNNSNKNKMAKSLKELIFGDKDSVLLAKIGETQFVYSKLEKGAKIKATGEGEKDPISGTFEADEKVITVVENEITAVDVIDNKQKEITALKAELKALKDNQLTTDEVAEVIIASNEKQDAKIKVLEDILAKAKITVSNPKLPEGEFKNDKPAGDETSEKKRKRIQKAIDAKVAETTEAFSKSQTNRRV